MQITRQEAEEVSQAINYARTLIVSRIQSIERKRSIKPLDKAVLRGGAVTMLDVLIKFHEAFKSEHRIGGY